MNMRSVEIIFKSAAIVTLVSIPASIAYAVVVLVYRALT